MSSRTPHCAPEILQKLIEQDLTSDELATVESHLNECPSCRKRLDDSVADPHLWNEVSGFLNDDDWDLEVVDDDDDRQVKEEEQQNPASSEAENILKRLHPWLDASDDPRMIGRFGGYEILGIIGEGGMGIVLKAFEPSLNRYVAIKVLAPHLASNGAARQRFSREARAVAAVLHENVIAIHRVEENRGLPYLVMPYIAGETLQKRLDDSGPLQLITILRIGRQIAAGLSAAHAQGLVHRDVKPGNILLERGIDRVTLTDFGLARAVDDATVTRSGVIAGTPQYMSPEQARGDAVDIRSDLFSLGGVLYAMATGRPPFRAETSFGVLRRITDATTRPITEINPGIPIWFERLVNRLHEKKPEDRYQTPLEVEHLMEECIAHLQQPTSAQIPTELMKPKRGRSILLWIFLSVLICMFSFVALVVAYLRMSSYSPPASESNDTENKPAGYEYVSLDQGTETEPKPSLTASPESKISTEPSVENAGATTKD